ncbi:alpha/beta fold hydrolase [Cronobacter sakazakii]|uniref:alpha/beta fold hydrolase n=1 Tax=Cronobacter sakazakii TaxID=28141 RepID=UPI000CFDA005|nr:alpha/beta hydrolase [Cronobacter sakazakii]ELY2561757.1 alpha/beta hydrolase [Cronobacter sakazakii]ELY3818237.1 alpha/beta hydrolase [Cronobacter sakazakii]ELY3834466.1 alpha/beta hydrolase [Cronobacter sakazakii]ELY5957556.1 alpha/beta hydrolase [Cronobacter sakazakii]
MQTTGMLPSTTASQTYKWHETEGVKIFCREAAPVGAPVIVLLHGYPSTSKMYAPLILWGKYDPSFIVPGAEAYLRDLPDAELHILDAGHFALDEASDAVAQLTLAFLDRTLR